MGRGEKEAEARKAEAREAEAREAETRKRKEATASTKTTAKAIKHFMGDRAWNKCRGFQEMARLNFTLFRSTGSV